MDCGIRQQHANLEILEEIAEARVACAPLHLHLLRFEVWHLKWPMHGPKIQQRPES